MVSGLPLPKADADGAPYWKAAADGSLTFQACTACGHPRFYPRVLCPECHTDQYEWRASTGLGTVYSYSVVRRSPVPEFADRVPYVVALIDLDEGFRMLSNVRSGLDDVRIGARVAVTFRAETDDIAVPEFNLITEGNAS